VKGLVGQGQNRKVEQTPKKGGRLVAKGKGGMKGAENDDSKAATGWISSHSLGVVDEIPL